MLSGVESFSILTLGGSGIARGSDSALAGSALAGSALAGSALARGSDSALARGSDSALARVTGSDSALAAGLSSLIASKLSSVKITSLFSSNFLICIKVVSFMVLFIISSNIFRPLKKSNSQFLYKS